LGQLKVTHVQLLTFYPAYFFSPRRRWLRWPIR